MFKKFIIVLLMAVTVFTVSGLGILSQPKPAEAVWFTTDVGEQLNKVLVAIWKFAIYPILKKLVMKIATGDLNINGAELLADFGNAGFQVAQAIILNYTGFSLCSDIKGNFRIAFARLVDNTNYIPTCTADRSKLVQAGRYIIELAQRGGTATEGFKAVEQAFLERFSVSIQGDNNDYGSWFGLRSNFLEQIQKKEENYRFELLVNQGFFGARDCSNVRLQNANKTEAAKSATVKKGKVATVDKYRDCRIKSPGLLFAEDAKKSIQGLKQGSIQAQSLQDIIALTGLFVDQLIETSLKGIWGAISGNFADSNQSPESTGTNAQRTGSNQQIQIPKDPESK